MCAVCRDDQCLWSFAHEEKWEHDTASCFRASRCCIGSSLWVLAQGQGQRPCRIYVAKAQRFLSGVRLPPFAPHPFFFSHLWTQRHRRLAGGPGPCPPWNLRRQASGRAEAWSGPQGWCHRPGARGVLTPSCVGAPSCFLFFGAGGLVLTAPLAGRWTLCNGQVCLLPPLPFRMLPMQCYCV
jgi:hypothetical protein